MDNSYGKIIKFWSTPRESPKRGYWTSFCGLVAVIACLILIYLWNDRGLTVEINNAHVRSRVSAIIPLNVSVAPSTMSSSLVTSAPSIASVASSVPTLRTTFTPSVVPAVVTSSTSPSVVPTPLKTVSPSLVPLAQTTSGPPTVLPSVRSTSALPSVVPSVRSTSVSPSVVPSVRSTSVSPSVVPTLKITSISPSIGPTVVATSVSPVAVPAAANMQPEPKEPPKKKTVVGVPRPRPDQQSQKVAAKPKPAPLNYWAHPVVYETLIGVDLNGITVEDAVFDSAMRHIGQSRVVPVVFVCYGTIPKFMLYTIEMASRLNPVIVVTNSINSVAIATNSKGKNSAAQPVFYLPMSQGNISDTQDFDRVYESIFLRDDQRRQVYEKQCFSRWLIVANIVAKYNIPNVFYADNDVVVLTNLTTALAIRKQAQQCDVMLSVHTDQPKNDDMYLGHLSGHSSFWSLEGLQDFSEFMLNVYRHYKNTLKLSGVSVNKQSGHQRVVDMTILYLYYVAHHRNSTGWDAGRSQSYRTGKLRVSEQDMVAEWQRYDFKFNQTRDKVAMPDVTTKLKLCNGLDVIDRACFDHMWSFYSTSFNLNIDSSALDLLSHYDDFHSKGAHQFRDPVQQYLPFIIGLTSYFGGKAESFDSAEVARLSTSALYFPTLHYQSNSKNWIPMDVCKRLVSRTQYFVEDASRSDLDTMKSVLNKKDDEFEAYMLDRMVSKFVREDCRPHLEHRAQLWPYMDVFHDRRLFAGEWEHR